MNSHSDSNETAGLICLGGATALCGLMLNVAVTISYVKDFWSYSFHRVEPDLLITATAGNLMLFLGVASLVVGIRQARR